MYNKNGSKGAPEDEKGLPGRLFFRRNEDADQNPDQSRL